MPHTPLSTTVSVQYYVGAVGRIPGRHIRSRVGIGFNATPADLARHLGISTSRTFEVVFLPAKGSRSEITRDTPAYVSTSFTDSPHVLAELVFVGGVDALVLGTPEAIIASYRRQFVQWLQWNGFGTNVGRVTSLDPSVLAGHRQTRGLEGSITPDGSATTIFATNRPAYIIFRAGVWDRWTTPATTPPAPPGPPEDFLAFGVGSELPEVSIDLQVTESILELAYDISPGELIHRIEMALSVGVNDLQIGYDIHPDLAYFDDQSRFILDEVRLDVSLEVSQLGFHVEAAPEISIDVQVVAAPVELAVDFNPTGLILVLGDDFSQLLGGDPLAVTVELEVLQLGSVVYDVTVEPTLDFILEVDNLDCAIVLTITSISRISGTQSGYRLFGSIQRAGPVVPAVATVWHGVEFRSQRTIGFERDGTAGLFGESTAATSSNAFSSRGFVRTRISGGSLAQNLRLYEYLTPPRNLGNFRFARTFGRALQLIAFPESRNGLLATLPLPARFVFQLECNYSLEIGRGLNSLTSPGARSGTFTNWFVEDTIIPTLSITLVVRETGPFDLQIEVEPELTITVAALIEVRLPMPQWVVTVPIESLIGRVQVETQVVRVGIESLVGRVAVEGQVVKVYPETLIGRVAVEGQVVKVYPETLIGRVTVESQVVSVKVEQQVVRVPVERVVVTVPIERQVVRVTIESRAVIIFCRARPPFFEHALVYTNFPSPRVVVYSRALQPMVGDVELRTGDGAVLSGNLVMPGGCDWYIWSPRGLFTSHLDGKRAPPNLYSLQDERYLTKLTSQPDTVQINYRPTEALACR